MKFLLLLLVALISAGLVHAQCPDQCRPTKRAAKRDCRGLSPQCEVIRCGSGFRCAPAVIPTTCPNTCQKKKKARGICSILSSICETVSCTLANGRRGLNCQDKITTPSPSPSPPPCDFCASNQFVKRLSNGQCSCENSACDACPDGTICRTIEFAPPGGMPEEVVYCQRCDCGYCDADGDNCCVQNGANCEMNNNAITSQCMYGDFEDGVEPALGAAPADENVCTDEGASISFPIAEPTDRRDLPKFLRQCACKPTNEEPCTISSDPGQTFCNIPRCNPGDTNCVR